MTLLYHRIPETSERISTQFLSREIHNRSVILTRKWKRTKHLLKKHRLQVFFFDYTRAFDVAWRFQILQTLHKRNLEEGIPFLHEIFHLVVHSNKNKFSSMNSPKAIKWIPWRFNIKCHFVHITINEVLRKYYKAHYIYSFRIWLDHLLFWLNAQIE